MKTSKVAVLAVLVCVGLIYLVSHLPQPQPPSQEELTRESSAQAAKDLEREKAKQVEEIREHPERNLRLTRFNWQKRGFDVVMKASFTIENRNDFDVKDLLILCGVFGGSGTVIGHPETTVYELIPRKSLGVFKT